MLTEQLSLQVKLMGDFHHTPLGSFLGRAFSNKTALLTNLCYVYEEQQKHFVGI